MYKIGDEVFILKTNWKNRTKEKFIIQDIINNYYIINTEKYKEEDLTKKCEYQVLYERGSFSIIRKTDHIIEEFNLKGYNFEQFYDIFYKFDFIDNNICILNKNTNEKITNSSSDFNDLLELFIHNYTGKGRIIFNL